jgi:hypothetical protein
VQETWRGIAGWVAQQLRKRYGESVSVRYFDLFDPYCPPLPEGAQLPVVLVDGVMLSSGGKISVPAIRARLDAALLDPTLPGSRSA